MKVKEIDRIANVAWSPVAHHPIYLATGTAAQQLDATFSTSAVLEIYSLNLTEPGHDMTMKASIPSDQRFHKIIWGGKGLNGPDTPSGIIAGGSDGGVMSLYNARSVLSGEGDGLIAQKDKHTGPVRAMDFNPFQSNLLATGASESEIFIWDLNNLQTPMSPGAKAQPVDDVTCIGWNRQVQHILASTFATRCVVWDLRKNEPIIKVSDNTSRMRCKVVAWHPDVATQMCLASEDDHTPIIQLWDLRFATSPLKTFENHQRGVLSIAWCQQDSDLLLSCGKDNRILCWNPNSDQPGGEVVCELPTSNQWSFDIAWCPRNPAMIASSSFDGRISVYSLMGGQQQVLPSTKIADSFPGMDQYAPAPAIQSQQRVAIQLKKPPKWLRKPCGATFSFGGRLITYDNPKISGDQPVQRIVTISQVVTETEFLNRSNYLESAIQAKQLPEFCEAKIAASQNETDKSIWSFLKVNLEPNSQREFLSLLGFKPEEVAEKVSKLVGKPVNLQKTESVDSDLANQMAHLARGTPDGVLDQPIDGSAAFDAIASSQSFDDSESPDLSRTFVIPTGNDADGLISQSLLVGNIANAVEICLQNDRMADAIVLATCGGPELLARAQRRYFQKNESDLSRLVSAIVTEDWTQFVQNCEIRYWKEALAAALTFTKDDVFQSLCATLGQRLEYEGNEEEKKKAMLCYICAGNLEKLVECWSKVKVKADTPAALQELVEQVMILKQAVEAQSQAPAFISSGYLSNCLTKYSGLLASQGSLMAALAYLGDSNEYSIAVLRDRLYNTLGYKVPPDQSPFCPVNVESAMKPAAPAPAPAPAASRMAPQKRPSFAGQVAQQQPSFSNQEPPHSYNQQPYAPPTSHQSMAPPPMHNVPTYSTTVNSAPVSSVRTAPGRTQPPAPGSNVAHHGLLHHADSARYGASVPASNTPNAGLACGMPHYPAVSSNAYSSEVHALVGPQDPSLRPDFQYNPMGNMYNYNDIANPEDYTSPVGMHAPGMHQPGMHAPGMHQPGMPGSSHQFDGRQQFAQSPPQPPMAPLQPPSASPGPPPPMQQYPIAAGNDPNLPSGWNDPPAVRNTPRSKPKVQEFAEPITHPIFGTAPPAEQQQYLPPQANVPGGMYAPPGGVHGPPGSMHAPPGGMQGPPGGMQGPPGGMHGPPGSMHMGAGDPNVPPVSMMTPGHPAPRQHTPPPANVARRQPEPPKPKAPVPAEHQVLCNVFNKLREACQAASNSPQTKRKMEDVSRKLEALYDKLRENQLSQNTLMGLHQIVHTIQICDYQAGLGVYTQMVSGGNFAEISSFMSGLKVLLQVAMQMQVYLQ